MGIFDMFGGMFGGGGGDSGGSQTQGYDVVTMPQYSFTEPRLRLTSDYLSQNIDRMSRGEYPAWYDKARPVMKEGMIRGLNQSTYGRPGERTGAMQNSMDSGAILGLGPKATWAQNRKLLNTYLDKSSQIDEYLTSLGVDVMRQGEGNYLQGSMSLPKGPDAQLAEVKYSTAGTSGNNPWGNLLNQGMGMAGDWLQGGGLTKMFSGNQGTANSFGIGSGAPVSSYKLSNSPSYSSPWSGTISSNSTGGGQYSMSNSPELNRWSI